MTHFGILSYSQNAFCDNLQEDLSVLVSTREVDFEVLLYFISSTKIFALYSLNNDLVWPDVMMLLS